MSFFTSGMFWFLEGIFFCLFVIGFKLWAEDKGLSMPLLAAVCDRLKSLGHCKTFLTTQTCRVPAINLYAKFGFVPVIESDADRQIWKELARHVKYPLRF